ncbi:MAG TPA: thioesterase family protein [Kofleriaceae bacterium]|nr:thioesterase family protein [Kofleriaceae bacterium]
MTLETATTPQGGVLDVPAGWRQGAGAYGGLVVASMMRAAEQAIGDAARTIRSVTAEIPAPVEPGRAELTVEVLRAGKSVTAARVALVQAGETRAHAVVIAATTRTSALAWNSLMPPHAPAWEALKPMPTSGPFPEFAQHFEFRVVEGIPTSGVAGPAIGWIRARAPGRKRDAAYLAAMIDAWFPVALVHAKQPHPMATIAFTLEVTGDASDVGDEALLYRGVSPVCTDGYSFETRELWTASGRLLARNHQTFVIIK